MKAYAALGFAVMLAACTGGVGGSPGGDDGGGGGGGGGGGADAGVQCSVNVQLSPSAPRVGVDETVRATASVLDVPGTISYTWQVTLDGNPTEADQAAPDNSAVDIPITTTGALHVMLTLDNQVQCDTASVDVEVLPTTFLTASYRLRVVPPPATGIPASDQIVQVHGGVDTFMPLGLPSSFAFTGGTVVDATGSGVAAYVRMTPVGSPSALVETYSGATGALPALRVLGQQHAALVIPDDPNLAPAVLSWMPGSNVPFAVSGGTTVSGVIHDPSGAALPGASVALSIGGVPSSVGLTGAGGAFALHATPAPGATVAITVTPPVASGLPRLVASSASIALGMPWTINYAAGLTTRDLSTVHVTRNSAPLANAPVAIVGALAGTAGTISDGTTNLAATGDVHLALTTDGTGALAGRAPAAVLSLAITRAADVSVSGFDLTTAAPASVASAAPIVVTGTTQTSSGGALGSTHISAVGTGALAGTTLETDADASGHFSLGLAGGGSYELHISDPGGRAVPLVQPLANPAAGDLGALQLPSTVHLAGTLSTGGAISLAGTAVQLLCSACTSPSDTPIAETAADANGRFRLAVPDPGAPPTPPRVVRQPRHVGIRSRK